ncbi:MAG: hypothetical protein IKD87_00335 [Oscillospiraceae bacterium]|nr:hypothetical protein [Oscillospiraceae bacterium]
MRRGHKKCNVPGKYKADVKEADSGSEITNTYTQEDPDAATHLNTDDASDLRTWFGMMLASAVLLGVSLVMRKRWNMV